MDRDYLPHVAEMNRSGGADPGLADYGRTGTLQLSYVRLNRVRYSFCPVKLFRHLLLTGLILPPCVTGLFYRRVPYLPGVRATRAVVPTLRVFSGPSEGSMPGCSNLD